MKCVSCGNFSLKPICKKCLESIRITPRTRVIEGISIYSFYYYQDISMLLTSKYWVFGSRLLKILAKKASNYFFDSHHQHLSIWKQNKLYGIGIDDWVRSYYSHTGVILKEFCKHGIKPSYGQLKAQNNVHYAGKSLQYRQANPRKFFYSGAPKNVFIVDDIITTGTTMAEAKNIVEKSGSNVLFGIALCDAGD
ncbi:ComF family protein [Helicobacter sp. 11S03491-1]|uniref:ComF family protein n=1 Tax=Helicobacter sp. 11S03491-1 TaxID=1476196 RepID=UPI000BA73805|nr:ComF family protein [Helicobacter sp. 11S03491-1]PAF41340.1 hypothetical protein BKH45_07490 [Helicobacter sp. 11S03491-1]